MTCRAGETHMLLEPWLLRGCLALKNCCSGQGFVGCADGGCAACQASTARAAASRCSAACCCGAFLTTTTLQLCPLPAGEREVTLLDYGAGNVRSVRNAIKQCGFTIKDVSPAVPCLPIVGGPPVCVQAQAVMVHLQGSMHCQAAEAGSR